jgi:hypothetical protein
MFAAAATFSNTSFTFWDLMLFLFFWIPCITIWFFCIFDVFARHDLSGGAKALWLLFIFILPWIGGITYLITRPSTPVMA